MSGKARKIIFGGSKMKSIVGGKVYNTDTAQYLHGWDNDYPDGDMKFVEESLYKTKKGAYFIHGCGGPMTTYAVSCGGGSYSGSEEITVLSVSEAIEWLEEHDGKEILEKYFADEIEEG